MINYKRPTILFVLAHKTDGPLSWIDRQARNMRKVHEADVVALHHIGHSFSCEIVKDRKGCGYSEGLIKMDSLINHLRPYYKDMPRKKKKACKKFILKQVNDYKESF